MSNELFAGFCIYVCGSQSSLVIQYVVTSQYVTDQYRSSVQEQALYVSVLSLGITFDLCLPGLVE